MSADPHQTFAQKCARMKHAHPDAVRRSDEARGITVKRPNPFWDDFSDDDARAWVKLLFQLPKKPLSGTVMACSYTSWESGSLPHANFNSEVARVARALGYTPQSAWTFFAAMSAARQERDGLTDGGQILFDLRLWALWIHHRQQERLPLEAAHKSLDWLDLAHS